MEACFCFSRIESFISLAPSQELEETSKCIIYFLKTNETGAQRVVVFNQMML